MTTPFPLKGARAEALFLTAACLLLLLPFVNKPVHMDDPCYVWAAQQIVEKPWDYYGFSINWYGYDMPMYEVNQNPPLVSYYLAIFGAAFGWREWVLHLAMILPALGVALGVWKLASRFSGMPLYATLILIVCPAFLVSATTLMVEVPMLCLYVWAIEAWCRGLDDKRHAWFALAAVLAALCTFSKYFGLTLLPLLLVYTLTQDRRNARYLLWLLLPGLALVAYGAWNVHLYGRSHVLDAFVYARGYAARSEANYAGRFLTTLAFTGACAAPLVFIAPLLWSRRQLLAWAVVLVCMSGFLALLVRSEAFPPASPELPRTYPWWFVLQLGLWTTAGLQILLLTLSSLVRQRDGTALFLFLWISGVFVFVWLLNWTVNARTVLPMLPPVAILAARRLAQRRSEETPDFGVALRWPLIASAALALWVAAADYSHAATARRAAIDISARNIPGTLWFSGHWGFQYYLQNRGAKPFDLRSAQGAVGDAGVVALDNSNPIKVEPWSYVRAVRIEYRPTPGMVAMNYVAGAGFYSSQFGPLPFVIGPGIPLRYEIYYSQAEEN